ncbi:uncharacterized protein RHOBADRAFT_50662 [Rhodotorula graminis WP1]|uniref:FAD-binding FR-type domain-containing protein n=1 Tax=Rhodotorula graminis (strain WP1) TaxID=578459 RepID=A0A194SF32_RHOGW|nr:uncharacterized protein RHOBADRAFT_50662 [Rhodotorula graminis WP1]KPV78156.1 hypothetical protein RHOBADRAFT_50662 [Rhodotorula graminis WP1]
MASSASTYVARPARVIASSSRRFLVSPSASSARATFPLLPHSPSPAWTPTRAYNTDKAPQAPAPAPRERSLLSIAGVAALVLGGGATFLLTRDEPAYLAPDRWTDVKIKSVTALTPETSLFKLDVPRSVLPPAFTGDPDARPILSLFVKEPSLQIQRAYTVRPILPVAALAQTMGSNFPPTQPLSASSFNESGPAELDLVVKRYPDGEASRYIHRLGPGDEMSVRGPSCTWYYRPQDWDEVVFVVGGTGVTPAYQLIHDTLASSSSSSAPSPTVSVVYASPSPSRILLRNELDALTAQRPGQLKVHYLVDRLDADPRASGASAPAGAEVGFLDSKVLSRLIGRGGQPEKRRVVVVCGPEGMVNAVAGPRGRNFSSGPVGGVLRELGYRDKEVVKL